MRKILICVFSVIFVSGCKSFVATGGIPALQNKSVILTTDEIAKHSSPDDCWIIIGKNVYGVTSFLNEHPGGSFRITPFCGKDATTAFQTQGGRGSHSAEAYKLSNQYLLGEVESTVTVPK